MSEQTVEEYYAERVGELRKRFPHVTLATLETLAIRWDWEAPPELFTCPNGHGIQAVWFHYHPGSYYEPPESWPVNEDDCYCRSCGAEMEEPWQPSTLT